MNTASVATKRVEKKIIGALLLACIFVLAANLSSWKANVTSANNARSSAIGKSAMSALSLTDASMSSGKLNLKADDLTSRAAFPAGGLPYLTLPTGSATKIMGSIDGVKQTTTGLSLRGWTFIVEGPDRPEFVVAVENGKVVGSISISEKRPDVAKALGKSEAMWTGYDGQIKTTLNTTSCNITLFALSSSLTLYPMPSVCDKAEATTH
jgi:hypothetical protein